MFPVVRTIPLSRELPITPGVNKSLNLIVSGEGKKKKKKKKPKKKKATEQQTEPPRVGLSKLFPDGNYPEGETHEYKDEYVRYMLSYVTVNLVIILCGREHCGLDMEKLFR